MNITKVNQKEFLLDLYKTKPSTSIPLKFLFTNEAASDEKELLRVPKEGIILLKLVLNDGAKSWSDKQRRICVLTEHYSEGIQLSSFNRWRSIALQTYLLFNVRKNKELDAVRLDIYSGIMQIENHLSAIEDIQDNCYIKGLDCFSKANEKLQKLQKNVPEKTKERVALLLECLREREELFPFLLIPLRYRNGFDVSDYGKNTLEFLLKMSLIFPLEAFQKLGEFDDFLKLLKKHLLLPLPPLEGIAGLVEKIGEALEKIHYLRGGWEKIQKLDENPSIKKYLGLTKLVEQKKMLTFDQFEEWREQGLSLKSLLNVLLENYESATCELFDFFTVLEKTIGPYFAKSKPSGSRIEIKNICDLSEVVDDFIKMGFSQDFSLRDCYRYVCQSIDSVVAYQKAVWNNRDKYIRELQDWLAISPLEEALPFERLKDATFLTLEKVKDHELAHNARFVFETLFLRMRSYYQLEGGMENKKIFFGHFLNSLELAKRKLKEYSKKDEIFSSLLTKVELLEALVLDRNNCCFCDHIFLLLKRDLNFDNQKSLDQTFKISLKSVSQELAYQKKMEYPSLTTNFNDPQINSLIRKFELFKSQQREIEEKLEKALEKDFETAAKNLMEYQDWAYNQRETFLMEFEAVGQTGNPLVDPFLAKLFRTFWFISYEKLEACIFSPTQSLRQWGFINSYEEKNKPKKTSPKPSISPPVSFSEEEEVEEKLAPIGVMELINRVSAATESKKNRYLENIQVDLLPSIVEIVEKGIFSKRLFEKTKLLLEQSLKFALEKKEKTYLYERTADRREQQRFASHDLLDLFVPLAKDFDDEASQVLSYFSKEGTEDLKAFVAKALVVSEQLLEPGSNGLKPFVLKENLPSQASHLEVPLEIQEMAVVLESQLQEIRRVFSKKRRLYTLFVERVNEKETDVEQMQRQFFLRECQRKMEEAISRLRGAFNEADRETPLAYCGELFHASATLLEKAQLLLITYFGIKGEGSCHKVFQNVSSEAQIRPFWRTHHLKQLSEILKEHFATKSIFDSKMEENLGLLQVYNSITHRYLSRDNTLIGKWLRDNVLWKKEVSKDVEEFIYPHLLQALQTTRSLLIILQDGFS